MLLRIKYRSDFAKNLDKEKAGLNWDGDRLTRQALRHSMSNDLDTQLGLEAQLQGEAAKTRDFVEGVAAFLEKRPASFEGR